ncbi:MAG TPA: hypothetical protein VLJ60_00360, partial [bacterium]|nr:hypothetical protein [bacterium]
MKKVLVVFIVMLSLTLMISCDKGDDCKNLESKCDGTVAMTCLAGTWEKEDCAEKDEVCKLVMDFATCVESTTNDSENDEEVTDEVEVTDDPEVTDEPEACTLNQDWLAPASEWVAWGYLRMSGGVGEYQGDYVEATFTEGKMKIAKGTTDLEYG